MSSPLPPPKRHFVGGKWKAVGFPDVVAPNTPQPSQVKLVKFKAKSIAPVTPPPDTPYPGYLPPITATELNAMLTAGTAVLWSSLQTGGDSDTTSTLTDGRTLHAYGSGVFQAIMNRCPSGKAIIFDQASVYEVNQPNWNTGDNAACQVPKTCTGLYGWVPPGTKWENLSNQRTTIRLKTMTAPAKNICGGWFKAGYSGSLRFDWANLHFESTEQGMQDPAWRAASPGPGDDGTSRRLFTGVFIWNQANGNTIRDSISTGSFGNNGAPPGETFEWEFYHSTNGRNCRLYGDGRRGVGTPIYSAVGHSFGNADQCILTDSWFHHSGQAGQVMFQVTRCKTYGMHLGDPSDRVTRHVSKNETMGDWLNHERSAQIEHYDAILDTWCVNRPHREHISNSNDNWTLDRSGINCSHGRPMFKNVKWTNILWGGKLCCATWIPYWTGNTMTTSDTIQVFDSNGVTLNGKGLIRMNYGSTWMDI